MTGDFVLLFIGAGLALLFVIALLAALAWRSRKRAERDMLAYMDEVEKRDE